MRLFPHCRPRTLALTAAVLRDAWCREERCRYQRCTAAETRIGGCQLGDDRCGRGEVGE
jgi:hypothetical protein